MMMDVYLQLTVDVCSNVAPLEQVPEEEMKSMFTLQFLLPFQVSKVMLQRFRPSVDVWSDLGECPACCLKEDCV